MTEQTEHSTLRRKAGTGRAPSDGAGMTAPKAFRLALSKAAEVELGLPMRAQIIKEELVNQAQVLEALDDESLLLMLEGPHDARGVAVFDLQALSALIEVQTLGKVLTTEAAKRRPTRIDGAMCEVLLDRVLKEFEGHLKETASSDWCKGYRFDKQVTSLRLLGLALTDVPYRLFHLPLDIADGAKQGLLQIVLPAQGVRRKTAVGVDGGWEQSMKLAVGDSHVEISGVLHRTQQTLAQVQAMQVGDLLAVPQACISGVSMEGSDGCFVGNARLGQQNGFRALRISGAEIGPPAAVKPVSNLAGDTGATGAGFPAADMSTADFPAEMTDTDMAMPAAMPAMDGLPDIGGLGDAPDFPAVDFPMPDMEGGAEVAPMGDLPDLPMMPMDAAPMEGLDDLEMAPMAMPMDIEIA